MKKKVFILLTFISCLFCQIDVNFSLESKYGQDTNASSSYPTFYENLLDINLYLDDLYMFAQLEYSNPPIMGVSKRKLSDALNTVYLQYFNERYDIMVGNLYLMYGQGLSLHTFQDQNIDYDNSLYGFESIYHINNNLDFYTVAGKKNIKSRKASQEIVPSITIDNRLFSLGVQNSLDRWNMHFISMFYQQDYDSSDILKISGLPTILGNYVEDTFPIESIDDNYSMDNLEHNIGFSYFGDYFEISYEKSFVYYNKLLSERESGYREYFGCYTNIFDFNIILEHKDYYTPYLYSLFANPPIVYRESNSILTSRNIHSLNVNNEYGFQFEVNKEFETGLNFLFNYAFAMHYIEDEAINQPNILDLYSDFYNLLKSRRYIESERYTLFNPFKQVYLEFSDWISNEKFYYKLAYDDYHEYFSDKEILAKTTPSQFVYKFDAGNSLTFYLEYQDLVKTIGDITEKHFYWYFSPSYNHFGLWSFTLFYDYEQDGAVDDEDNSWIGGDCTININDLNQLSIFYGSQKGGLVCANGSCVLQPDFDDGFKVTFRTSF